jgi:sulfur-carrier protein adenylyltransferase/sulfurtransferase
MTDLELTPAELKQRIDRKENFLLIDVREPHEYQICRIESATLMPMRTIPANLQQLDTDEEVICYCHHGMRSLDVVVWLQGQGVRSARSLAGGIDRWSLEIDPQVPRY